MLHYSRNVTIMLNDFLIMLTLAQVLTQLHVSACASLSLGKRDMTTDAVVGLVLPVVRLLRLLLSVSNTCFSLPSQPFTIVYRREHPHTRVATMPKILVMLSKMPAIYMPDALTCQLCSKLCSPNRRSPNRDCVGLTLHRTPRPS